MIQLGFCSMSFIDTQHVLDWGSADMSTVQWRRIKLVQTTRMNNHICFFSRSVSVNCSISANSSNSWWWHHFALSPGTWGWCCLHDVGVDETWPETYICPCEACWSGHRTYPTSIIQRTNISFHRWTEARKRFTETVQSETFWWRKIPMLHSKTEHRICHWAHCGWVNTHCVP